MQYSPNVLKGRLEMRAAPVFNIKNERADARRVEKFAKCFVQITIIMSEVLNQ